MDAHSYLNVTGGMNPTISIAMLCRTLGWLEATLQLLRTCQARVTPGLWAPLPFRVGHALRGNQACALPSQLRPLYLQASVMFPSTAECSRLLGIAEFHKPTLLSRHLLPIGRVIPVRSEDSPLGWSADIDPRSTDIMAFVKGDTVVFDFGEHLVGYLAYDVVACSRPNGRNPCRPDSPARLRIVFAEVLSDLESFEPFTGWLSQAWLPEESFIVDYFPEHIEHKRRHAFRYVKIEVIDTSVHFAVRFDNFTATSVTSASTSPSSLTMACPISDRLHLSGSDRDLLRKIDEVSMRTLRNCMQTVYEDGPRRDRRLWIGDIRLQCLANYVTFRDTKLAKRCYYLLAALPADDEGRISACVFENPTPMNGGDQIVDYSLLFANSVHEFVQFSGDIDAGRDLYPMARKQLDFVLKNVSPEGVYEIPDDKSWHFIDWCEQLDRTVSEHSVLITSLRALAALEALISYPPSTATTTAFGTLTLTELANKLVSTARRKFFDQESGVFVSGADKQISWASNAWAIIADIPENEEQGAGIMKKVYTNHKAIKAVTPYLHHYLVTSFLKVGLKQLALAHIMAYWGSMIAAGADTFFEAWDPIKPRHAIYDDFHLQSFCHAWSCTPAFLLRQMGFS